MLCSGMASPSENTDLSTLASVVTTLAAMDRGQDENLQRGIVAESLSNCEIAPESVSSSDLAAKAFDVLTKALHSPMDQGENIDFVVDHSDTSVASQEMEKEMLDLEGPILTESNFQFSLATPAPLPVYLTIHYICETASRLLFLSVHWARNIAAFQLLDADFQVLLIRSCWSELFVLGLAQSSQAMNLSTILAAILNHLQTHTLHDKSVSENSQKVIDTITWLQEYVGQMSRLQVDDAEYAYLKTLVLFSPDALSSHLRRQTERFQDKAQHELHVYDLNVYPDQTDRLGRLLLRLPALRQLSPTIMEELFFTGLIGNVEIDSIIPHILRLDTTDYNLLLKGNNSQPTFLQLSQSESAVIVKSDALFDQDPEDLI